MAVYLIQAGEGPVKVGKADDVMTRLRTLQTAHYEILHVRRFFENSGHQTEGSFKAAFRRFHLRNEWYRFDEAMLTWQPPSETEQEVPEVPAWVRDGVLQIRVR
jgi:hypothetical protein